MDPRIIEVGTPFIGPDGPIPGYVAGHCGHRVALSEWRAGFRDCERCAVNKRCGRAVASHDALPAGHCEMTPDASRGEALARELRSYAAYPPAAAIHHLAMEHAHLSESDVHRYLTAYFAWGTAIVWGATTAGIAAGLQGFGQRCDGFTHYPSGLGCDRPVDMADEQLSLVDSVHSLHHPTPVPGCIWCPPSTQDDAGKQGPTDE